MSSSGTNLWLFLEVLARRRGLILSLVIITTIIALAISLFLPKYYRAEALLLPPKDTSLPVAGVSQLTDVVSVTKGLNLPVLVTTSDVYARMLASRRVTDPIFEQFDLVGRYQSLNRDLAYETFMAMSSFEVTPEGLLRVAIEDRDPDMAAKLVNALVDRLDEVNRSIATERVRENKGFIESRLQQVQQELDSARANLEAFQMTHKAIDFDQQARLAVEQAIQLKVRLAETDINLNLARGKLSKDNTDLLELQKRRETIADQIALLESTNYDSSFFSLPIASIPRLRGEYDELYGKVRINEGLHRTLLTHLEQVKLQENEGIPTITILDRAIPPHTKSRPKRSVIVLSAFGASLLVAILLASLLEYIGRLRHASPDDYQRARLFISAFLGWLPGINKIENEKTGNKR